MAALNQAYFSLLHLHIKTVGSHCEISNIIPYESFLSEQKEKFHYIDSIQHEIYPFDVSSNNFIRYKCNEKLIFQWTDILVQSIILKVYHFNHSK